MLMKIKVERTSQYLASKVRIADSMFSRMKGLMFLKEMNGFDGILLNPGNSIHTFFMKMNIDVIFLDKNNKVVKFFKAMKPWKMTRIYFSSVKVIELNEGTISDLNIGDQIIMENNV